MNIPEIIKLFLRKDVVIAIYMLRQDASAIYIKRQRY